MVKKVKGKITISSPSGYDCDYVSITVEDKVSSLEIIEIKVSYEEFTRALMHQAFRPCDIRVDINENIGKQQERDFFEFKMPTDNWNKEVAKQTAIELCPSGWEPDLHFSSQSSFFRKNDEQWARTTIRRWV